MKIDTQFIKLNNGTEICAPSDVNLMTNYILREQGDWFEDEINFVRKFVEPGMNAIDIGANYGLYASAMASSLTGEGKLWCFEPTPNTAAALRNTIAKNAFEDTVEVIEAGLSDHEGEASFFMAPNAELNSLTRDENSDMEEVTIKLRTMDECAKSFGWPAIDFIKLDAEGEEINILKGGEDFFASQSPVVMFELKHGNQVNMPLIDAFKTRGYGVYCLVPGLDVLAPFDEEQNVDGFLLNLFAIKEEKLEALQAKGLAVAEAKAAAGFDDPEALKQYFSAPCFESMSIDFTSLDKLPQDYRDTLVAYVLSQDESRVMQERYDYLMFAAEHVHKALKAGGEAKAERLSSFARIAYASGHRVAGNQILQFLVENFIKHSRSFMVVEPFLAVSEQFEQVETRGQMDAWLCCAILDELARKQAYSSFFGGIQETVKFVEVMEKLNFLLPDMNKRIELIKERFKK